MKEILLNAYDVERNLPANFEPADRALFEHELHKTFDAVNLITLCNAYVLNDLVYSSFQFYVPQSLSYPMIRWEQLKRLPYFLKQGATFDKCIWITDDWSGGYFHWMMDALPRLMVCKNRINGHKVLLHESYRPLKYTLRTLELLGMDYVFYSEKCHVKELLLPDHVAASGNYYLPVFQSIRTDLLKNVQGKEPHKKIYVSRKNTRFRRLLNEEEYIALLDKFGFEIHYFEKYSLDEQMQLMQETKYLIGLHGNALTNIYFMQDHTKVLELRFENDKMNNCFFAMAAANNIDYYYQVGIGTSGDTHIADMVIDLKEAEKNLERMLS